MHSSGTAPYNDHISFFRIQKAKILQVLDVYDARTLESGDIVLSVPEKTLDAASNVDSDRSDEESAGDLNILGPRLMRTKCKFIPHHPCDDSVE